MRDRRAHRTVQWWLHTRMVWLLSVPQENSLAMGGRPGETYLNRSYFLGVINGPDGVNILDACHTLQQI